MLGFSCWSFFRTASSVITTSDRKEWSDRPPGTQDEVKKIILLSKPTTCSLDSLPTPFFLEFLDELLPTITQLLNNSILSGIFPSSFKTAIV